MTEKICHFKEVINIKNKSKKLNDLNRNDTPGEVSVQTYPSGSEVKIKMEEDVPFEMLPADKDAKIDTPYVVDNKGTLEANPGDLEGKIETKGFTYEDAEKSVGHTVTGIKKEDNTLTLELGRRYKLIISNDLKVTFK